MSGEGKWTSADAGGATIVVFAGTSLVAVVDFCSQCAVKDLIYSRIVLSTLNVSGERDYLSGREANI